MSLQDCSNSPTDKVLTDCQGRMELSDQTQEPNEKNKCFHLQVQDLNQAARSGRGKDPGESSDVKC